MTAPGPPSAEARRAAIRAEAAAIGVDEVYVDRFVEAFYARVRADATLGPIFERAIGDGWGAHMARLKDFWASVALNTGRYSGKPVPVHLSLDGLTRAHFTHWLALFRATLLETAPSPEAHDYLMARAGRISESLQAALFDRLEPVAPRFR